MLILTRTKDDWIYLNNHVDGSSVKIKVVETRAGSVVLGVCAPPGVNVVRDNAKGPQRRTPRRYCNTPPRFQSETCNPRFQSETHNPRYKAETQRKGHALNKYY